GSLASSASAICALALQIDTALNPADVPSRYSPSTFPHCLFINLVISDFAAPTSWYRHLLDRSLPSAFPPTSVSDVLPSLGDDSTGVHRRGLLPHLSTLLRSPSGSKTRRR